MKKQPSAMQEEIDFFEIKNPKWTFWACLLVMVGSLVSSIVFFYLNYQKQSSSDTLYTGYILLFVAFASAIGVYVCVYEKLTYSNGVYMYYRPFGKNQLAKVEDIESIKIVTAHIYTRYGGNKRIRVFFYNKHKNILIKIADDGTLSENAMFLKSVKVNRIKLVRE